MKEDDKMKKNKTNKVGLRLMLVASFALVIGLVIGNSILPATQFVGNDNASLTKKNYDEINIDMTPRLVNVQNVASTFEDVAPQVSCCVVGVSCVGADFTSVGSGVAVADGGYILTNQHVIDEAQKISVLLADGSYANAQLLWADQALDLAILKSQTNLPYLALSSENEISVGEPIMAVGTPLSLQFQHTHTAGIVSALNRNIAVKGSDGEMYMQSYIQHDASINPGNSGGPAITLDGKVAGINTLKITDAEGMGFAIPAWIIKPVLNHIVEDGFYKTVYIGLYGFDSSIAKYYGEEIDERGVVVVKVDEQGPCGKLGLKGGDLVMAVGEKQISTMLDLRLSLYEYKVGDKVSLTLQSDGKIVKKDVVLQQHPNYTN